MYFFFLMRRRPPSATRTDTSFPARRSSDLLERRGGHMLKERLAIANKVAREVHDAETAIDLAIAKLGILATSLPKAQAAAKLSSVVGDRAFGHLQDAIANSFSGRARLVALHNELEPIGRASCRERECAYV